MEENIKETIDCEEKYQQGLEYLNGTAEVI